MTIDSAAQEPLALTLDRLWREFARDLRDFILRRVSSPQDAEDILQLVFLRMHRGLGALRNRDRLVAWMYTLTRNAITDHYRSASRRRELAVGTLPDSANPDDPLGDETLARRELVACLLPMLSSLPADQAAAVRVIDLEGKRQADAATEAGISVSGMKSRVQRGRAALRRLLLACCDISVDPRGSVQEYRPRDGDCDCAEGSSP